LLRHPCGRLADQLFRKLPCRGVEQCYLTPMRSDNARGLSRPIRRYTF